MLEIFLITATAVIVLCGQETKVKSKSGRLLCASILPSFLPTSTFYILYAVSSKVRPTFRITMTEMLFHKAGSPQRGIREEPSRIKVPEEDTMPCTARDVGKWDL